MKYVYPAILRPENTGYCVFFPDIREGATQGETVAECIDNAQDFLNMALYDMEKNGRIMPKATDVKKVAAEQDDIVTLINADTDWYRRFYENKLVKKTLNIPSWLNERAEAANVNFSQELQSRLKEVLKVG